MTTIAVCTFKGGCGKTTTALNLAASLAASRQRVLGVDLDRTQRDLVSYEGLVPSVDFRASTAGRLPRLLERAARDEYSCVVIDCPPALEKEPAAALRVADIAVVPVQPELLSARGLSRFMQAVQVVRNPRLQGSNPKLQIVVLITMLDTRDTEACDVVEAIRSGFAPFVFPDAILRQGAVNAANNAGISVLQHAPRSQGAQAYKTLARHILQKGEHHGAK